MRPPLRPGALPVAAARPAARPTLTFLQLLLGPANAALSGHVLLGILHPADELVAGKGRDVPPSVEGRWVGGQRRPQVRREFVDHPARNPLALHGSRLPGSEPGRAPPAGIASLHAPSDTTTGRTAALRWSPRARRTGPRCSRGTRRAD